MDNNEVMTNEVMDNTEENNDLVIVDLGQESEGMSTTTKVGLIGLGVAGVAAIAVATKKPRKKAKRWIAGKLKAWSDKTLAEPVEEPKESETESAEVVADVEAK